MKLSEAIKCLEDNIQVEWEYGGGKWYPFTYDAAIYLPNAARYKFRLAPKKPIEAWVNLYDDSINGHAYSIKLIADQELLKSGRPGKTILMREVIDEKQQS